MTNPEEPIVPGGGRGEAPTAPDDFYRLMWCRRQHFESMLWQTPVIALTAQAFLFTIALDSETRTTGRILSALLLVGLSTASALLFQKHRALEVKASRWLEALEVPPNRIHGRQGHARCEAGDPWILSVSSYSTWLKLLWGTTALSVFVFLIAVLRPDLLGS